MADVEIATIITQGVAASRPAAADALEYYATDTKVRSYSNGSSWSDQPPPGTELSYVEFTSAPVNISATVEASADTIVTAAAIAFDGATVANIEFFCPDAQAPSAANGYLVICLFDGSSSIGFLTFRLSVAATPDRQEIYAVRRLTPSNASHTYSIRAFVSALTGALNPGAGGSGNRMPGYIRITKV
jgi:hypothetical protein